MPSASRPSIVVVDGYTLNPGDNPWEPVSALGNLTVHDRTAPAQVRERCADADIVVTNKLPLTAALIESLPNLKFITVTATGFNIVDINAAKNSHIPVSNVPEYGTDSVAQTVFALLLELTNHVGLHDQAVKNGDWTNCPDFSFWQTPLIELAGKTLGIVGYGRIGRRVGEIAEAFGMKLITAGRDPKAVHRVFSEADVVTLHCPQTPQNAAMVNRDLLATMKPGALLINTARGGLVLEQDLADALNAGRLAGAAVDVVSIEPMRPDNPLLKARNCIITPHNAWATREARQRLMQSTAKNIAAFLAGKPINIVNG